MTPEVLAKIEDGEVEQVIVDSVIRRVGSDYRNAVDIVTSLPVGHQVVYTTFFLEAEVSNGGFLQYFYNSAGEFAEVAVESLKRMGASEHAGLLLRAMELLLEEAPRLKSYWAKRTIEGFMASYGVSRLPTLDKEWYRLPALPPLRLTYIRSRSSDFRE